MRIASRIVLAAALIATAVEGSGCSNRPKPSAHPADASLGISNALPATSLRQPTRVSTPKPALEITATRQPWQFAEHAGHVITTPNYRLYTTVVDPVFLERLPVFYELALAHYTTALANLPMPTVPLETYLFQSRRQWQAKTQEMLPEQAEMFSSLGRGGFTTRGTSVLYYIDRWGYPSDTFAIAAHEGWHQYTQQTFKQQLPIWLEEGIATYMEGYRRGHDDTPEFHPAANHERWRTLREAVRREQLIPLSELLTRSPQSFLSTSKDALLVYYAQVWALTRFLAEGDDGRYRPALAQVLADAAEGRLVARVLNSASGQPRRGVSMTSRAGPAVVQEYFNPDLSQFEREYRLYIEELTRSVPPRRSRAPSEHSAT